MKRHPKITTSLRLSESTREGLRRAAEAEVRSLSSMAEVVVRNWLAAHGYLPGETPPIVPNA